MGIKELAVGLFLLVPLLSALRSKSLFDNVSPSPSVQKCISCLETKPKFQSLFESVAPSSKQSSPATTKPVVVPIQTAKHPPRLNADGSSSLFDQYVKNPPKSKRNYYQTRKKPISRSSSSSLRSKSVSQLIDNPARRPSKNKLARPNRNNAEEETPVLSKDDLNKLTSLFERDETSSVKLPENPVEFNSFIDSIKENRIKDLKLAMSILKIIDKSREPQYTNNTGNEEFEKNLSKLLFDNDLSSFDKLPRAQRHTLQSFMKEMETSLAGESISRDFIVSDEDEFDNYLPPKRKRPTSLYELPTTTPRPRPPRTRAPPSPPTPRPPGGLPPSPPTRPGRRPSPPTGPGGRPSPPTRPVGRPSPPTRPVGRPSPPTRPVGRPSPPTRPVGRPSPPTRPVGRPSPPTSPGGRPSPPTRPGGRPSPPTRPGGRPSPPRRPGTESNPLAFIVPNNQDLPLENEGDIFFTSGSFQDASSDDGEIIFLSPDQNFDVPQQTKNQWIPINPADQSSVEPQSEQEHDSLEIAKHNYHYHYHSLSGDYGSAAVATDRSSEQNNPNRFMWLNKDAAVRRPQAIDPAFADDSSYSSFSSTELRAPVGPTGSRTPSNQISNLAPAPAPPPVPAPVPPPLPLPVPTNNYNTPNALPQVDTRPQTTYRSPPPVQTPPVSYRQPLATPPRTYGPPPAAAPMTYGPPPAAPPRDYGPPPAAPPRDYGPPPAAPPRDYGPPPATAPRTYGPPPAAPPMTYGPPLAAPQMTYGPPPADPPAAEPPGERTRVVFLSPVKGKGKGRKRKKNAFNAFSVTFDDSQRSPPRSPSGYQRDQYYSQRDSLRDEYWRSRERLLLQQQEAFNLEQLSLEISLQEKQRKEIKKRILKNFFKGDDHKGMKGFFKKGAMALGAMSLFPLTSFMGRRKKRDLSGDFYPLPQVNYQEKFFKNSLHNIKKKYSMS